jgi:predicted RNA binding protein YcfA (HicA-like mRNA interferase family)
MAKRLVREIQELAKDYGFEFDGWTGTSHARFKNPTTRRTVIVSNSPSNRWAKLQIIKDMKRKG